LRPGRARPSPSNAYRLLKFAKTKRILFLVDCGNLGKQTEDEFANFEAPDDRRKFPTPSPSSGSRRTLSIPRRRWSSPPFNGS
jgi:type I site-specific restriction endonuclease